LNAIFTAAARHLAGISKYKTAEGIVRYQGVTLRNLTHETAIRYHNACIAYLIELSKDAEHVQDENLLAAVVVSLNLRLDAYGWAGAYQLPDSPILRRARRFTDGPG
jgi:hypothetical protein